LRGVALFFGVGRLWAGGFRPSEKSLGARRGAVSSVPYAKEGDMPSDGFDQPALESLSDAPGVGDAEAALQVEVECAERVNFAMQQNGVPLVERVSITNTGVTPAER